MCGETALAADKLIADAGAFFLATHAYSAYWRRELGERENTMLHEGMIFIDGFVSPQLYAYAMDVAARGVPHWGVWIGAYLPLSLCEVI